MNYNLDIHHWRFNLGLDIAWYPSDISKGSDLLIIEVGLIFMTLELFFGKIGEEKA